MGRPAKVRLRTAAQIDEDIAAEVAQHALLLRDLGDALLAGENTAPYRGAIAAIGEKIRSLRAALDEINEAEEARRSAEALRNASEIFGEAERRHVALVDGLKIPPSPMKQGVFQ